MRMPYAVYEGSEPYLFISYSHLDAGAVEPLLKELTEKGFRFWYDEGIAPGSEWPEDVARHLNGAAVVLAFISPNSMNSENCRREINFALSKEKPLLSVTLEKTKLPLGMEMQLSSHQSVLRYSYTDWQSFADKVTGSTILATCVGEAAKKGAAPWPRSEQKPAPAADPAKDAKLMAIFTRAAELAEKEDYTQELQVLAEGLQVDPENCSLHVKLGRCYRRLNMPQKALECYERAKSINPGDPTIYMNIGAVYLTSDQVKKAKPFYEQGLNMAEENPLSLSPGDRATMYANYGRCIGMLGDLEGAKRMLFKARRMGYDEKYLKAHCDALQITLDAAPAAKPQSAPTAKPQPAPASKPQPAASRPAAQQPAAQTAPQHPPVQPKKTNIFIRALRTCLYAGLFYLLYTLINSLLNPK